MSVNTAKKRDLYFAFLILFFIAFSFWKVNKGMGFMDEAFYLTIPKRILQGDTLLVDEWHLSQLSGFLLVPWMVLYNLVVPDGIGIVLFFRLIYVVIQALFVVYLYICIRDRAWPVLAILPFAIYVPFNIMALSYNSMAIQCLSASLATINRKSVNLSGMFFAGLLYAASVLCCPYLVLLYLIYVFIALLRKIKRFEAIPVFHPRNLIAFSAGCLILAIITISHIIRGPLDALIPSITEMLNDPAHPARAIWQIIRTYFTSLAKSSFIALPIMGIYFGLFVWGFADTRLCDGRNRDKIFFLSVFTTFIYTLSFFAEEPLINVFGIPIAIIGLFSFITAKKKDWVTFALYYLPAMSYTFFIHCGSNQYFYAISGAAIVACIPSVLLLHNRLNQMEEMGHFSTNVKLISVFTVLTVCACMLYCRVLFTCWDGKISELSSRIDTGANQGVWTTEANSKEYSQIIEDTQFVREQSGKVLYIALEPELYLMDDKEMASYSAYENLESIENYGWEKLQAYYLINPDKRADCIYLRKSADITPEQIMEILNISGEIIESELGYTILVD